MKILGNVYDFLISCHASRPDSAVFARGGQAQLFVNLYIGVPETLTAFELSQLEEEIVTTLKAERKCHRPIVLPRIVCPLIRL
jgi:hypothetical protein